VLNICVIGQQAYLKVAKSSALRILASRDAFTQALPPRVRETPAARWLGNC